MGSFYLKAGFCGEKMDGGTKVKEDMLVWKEGFSQNYSNQPQRIPELE